MACQTPFRDDLPQILLYKIASCLAEGGGGGGVAGVTSFNLRTGVVTLTSGDVTGALGFTPISQTDGDARYVLKTGDTMTGALSIDNGSQVASTPFLNLTQTWNNAAVTFTGLFSNITNTASNTNSNVFNFQVDGVDRFNFTPGGSFRVVRQDATDSGMNLFLRKRGNAGSATGAVAADSTIGTVAYSGWDGAAFATGSRVSGLASEAWTGIAHGSRIDLYTTPIGSVTEQIALRLSSTGQSQFLDGTAALPSLSFQSDTDTGIYRIGADSFGSSAGGSVILATSTTGINLTTALAYQYNSFNVIRAQTALNNYFFGPSGNLTMTGASNTSVGASAFISNTTGLNNSAFGFSALTANTTGSNNTSIGFRSLLANTTGNNNTAVGRDTLAANTTGSNLTAIGYEALFSNTTGISNSAIGLTSLKFNTSGSENTANGVAALLSNTTGSQNTASGRSALGLNTTGINNTAIGYLALGSNTIGDDNSAIGRSTLFFNTSGSRNTGLGFDALQNNTTGNNNTSSGYQSLNASTTGSNNTANGTFALMFANGGGDNSAFGGSSLLNLTTGSSNTAVGFNTGLGITTGSNNTILGANVAGLAAALSNNIILADGAGVIRLQIDSSGNTTLAGTVQTAAGTAALPAYSFTGDPNTGLYNIGADSIGLSTGGTLRVTTNTTDLLLATGFRLAFASGANQRAGNAVLVAGTVTVANTSVSANTVVMLTRKTSGGTLGTAITYTVIDATSFTITSDSALDTSTFSYLLVEVP